MSKINPAIVFVYSQDFGVNHCQYIPCESMDSALNYIRDNLGGVESPGQSRFYVCDNGLNAYPIKCSEEGSALHLAYLTPHGFFKLQSSAVVNVEMLSRYAFIPDVYGYKMIIIIDRSHND